MDGQYIYSVGGKPENKHQMDVHRLDLTTRKWELLYKACEDIQVAIYTYLLEVFFYKGRIYIFNSKLGGALHSEFTVSVKYILYQHICFLFSIIL